MKTGRFLVMLSLLLVVAGCSKDGINEGPDGTGQHGEIRFEIGFGDRTRVSTGADFTSAWENGDEIGIFAVEHGVSLSSSPSVNYINNVKLTYSSADGGSWELSEPLYWPTTASGISALDFYAYYPYDANGGSPATLDPTSIGFGVQSDQSAAADYGASDLLTAKSTNGGSGWSKGSTVALTFGHALSLVQVDISERGAVPEYDSEHLTVTMHGVLRSATLDLGSSVAVGADGSRGSVVMTRVATGDDDEWIYRAIVPSQSVATGAVLFSFEQDVDDDGDYEKDFTDFRFVYCAPQTLTLAAGEYTEFDIETGWGDHGQYTAAAWHFIRWAQLTDGWKTTDFMLTSDIDLTGYDWKPVGEEGAQFTRMFNGGGYTIAGLSVNTSAKFAGLFGFVGPGGSVRNVTVSGTVEGTGSYTGGIAGYNDGTITGCSFSGTVTGTRDVGGIVGMNYGPISGCSVGEHSTVTGTGTSSNVGGIAGNSNSTITGCSVGENSTVTGTGADSRVGGIAGSSSAITGCSVGENSTVTVTGTGNNSNVGGIAGYSDGGTITGCSVGEHSTVTGTGTGSNVGGIAGRNISGATITGSWSAAKSVTGTGYVGGIAGRNDMGGAIRYCYWLWDNPTGFGGNAVGENSGTLSDYSSFDSVSALNGKVSDMNTAISSSGWEWVEGDNTAIDWPTIEKK